MNRNIKLLLGTSILIHSGVNFLSPIFAIYIGKIGGTMLDAGVAVGIHFFVVIPAKAGIQFKNIILDR